VLILAALAVEASWKLAPTNLLIEKPQIYALAACVFLCVLAGERKIGLTRTGLHLGLAFSAGYLVKVSMLAFAPALALLWAFITLQRYRRGEKILALAAAAMALAAPVLLTLGIWKVIGPSHGCMSDPLAVFASLLGGNSDGSARDLLVRFVGAELDYLHAFKLPLTMAAGAGLALTLLSPRLAAIPLALALYVALYFGALYAYHLGCFGAYYFQELNSIDRFTRVPLRVLHLTGLILPALAFAPRLSACTVRRGTVAILAVIVLALGARQVQQLNHSFATMANREDSTPEQVAMVRTIRSEAALVSAAVQHRPELARRPLMIAQGSSGYEVVIANYFALGQFRLPDLWSWGPTPANVWMAPASIGQMRETLMGASLIWPVTVDAWMSAVLNELIRDHDCRTRTTDYLLIPVPAAGELTCLRIHPAS
ncbi:MAG: hypothetical protein K2X44_02975, partial [Magnetospirillum sp.]|nr:hypothetical protein [Magnetospirillum sp.]